MRYIRLDGNNMVVTIRTGVEIVDGEIQSDTGECGQIMQPDGSFITPEPLPQTPSQLDILQSTVDQLVLDALGV